LPPASATPTIGGGLGKDETPLSLFAHRVFPELAQTPRSDLDQLFQTNRVAAKAHLEDANGLGVLETAKDELLLLVSLDHRRPGGLQEGSTAATRMVITVKMITTATSV
jgi:hypothetical protein